VLNWAPTMRQLQTQMAGKPMNARTKKSAIRGLDVLGGALYPHGRVGTDYRDYRAGIPKARYLTLGDDASAQDYALFAGQV